MYCLDFEYDNKRLSSLGYIICSFNDSSDVEAVNVGSTITYDKIAVNKGKKQLLSGTRYESCIQSIFDICKDPDKTDVMEITSKEYRELSRWLNRNEFLKVRFFDNEQDDAHYYNASFNLEKLKIGDITYGIRLTMETDSPFGHGAEILKEIIIPTENQSFQIEDESDVIGYISPYLEVICNSNGDLIITNETTGQTTEIKNCDDGETIKMYGDTLIIETSSSHHDISNSFNYEFLKIENTFNNRINDITVSLPCNIKIKYYPIIKDFP